MSQLCLSFDVDWALDEVVADTLDLLDSYGQRATWFLTHAAAVNERIIAAHAVGVHPNFNPALDGDGKAARETLAAVMELAPGAKAIRSHSLVRSSRLAQLFVEAGFTHESNILIPPAVGASIRPWRDCSGLVQVPIRWEDDVMLIDPELGDPSAMIGKLDVVTTDFHPIHVFLNTRTIDDYERARPHFRNYEALSDMRIPAGSGGTRDRLVSLLETARAAGLSSVAMTELQPAAGGR